MMFGPSIVEAKDSEAAGSMMVCVCVCVCAFVCCVCVCVCMYVVCCVCVCVCASFPLMAIPQSTPKVVSLVLGLTCGSLFSFAVRAMLCQCNPFASASNSTSNSTDFLAYNGVMLPPWHVPH